MGLLSDFLEKIQPNDVEMQNLAQQRLIICSRCSHFSATKQCTVCGCFMNLKTKLKRSKCPIGKW